MSHRALYYPEWGVPDATFLSEALIYWNSLTCIIPFQGLRTPCGVVA